MLQQYYNENLLELKDVIIKKIETTDNEKRVWIELLREEHACPVCGTMSDQVHDYRDQKVRDLSMAGKKVTLILRKRRYVCPDCGKRMPEINTFLARYQRLTTRCRAHLISCFSSMRTGKSIAIEHGYSITSVLRMFDQIQHPLPKLPQVIAIDEFKGNAGGA